MDRPVLAIEKFSEFKKALKTFTRGMIKSKVFVTADNKINITVTKEENYVEISMNNGTFYAEFSCEPSKRIFNKIDKETIEKILVQFTKLKNFNGFDIKVVE